MSRRRARLLVAGLGRIGRLHAENLSGRVASAELAGVVDAIEPVAQDIGELHDVRWWTSFREAVSDPTLDGVVIATPTGLHPELVELAASAGKHVFCEKPLGFNVEGSRRAVAAATSAGVGLQVGFQRRFDREWTELKRLLGSGSLGALRLFRSSHRNARKPGARRELGDVFVDIAIHDLDAAIWLGGEVEEVYALAGSSDSAAISLRFASRALGIIDVSRSTRYGFECSAELIGAEATARTGYQYRRGAVETLRDGRTSAELAADHGERHAAAYVRELERFGELTLGRGASESPGEAAVAALALALAARTSARTGKPIPVPTSANADADAAVGAHVA